MNILMSQWYGAMIKDHTFDGWITDTSVVEKASLINYCAMTTAGIQIQFITMNVWQTFHIHINVRTLCVKIRTQDSKLFDLIYLSWLYH